MDIDIKKGNKVIAKFVGTRYLQTLDYHENWHTLMTKVVAKITNRSANDMGVEEKKLYNYLCSNLYVVDIELTYMDCVRFINEHNNNVERKERGW